MPIEKERIRWIDIAKGICIVSVIAAHLGNDFIYHATLPYNLTVFFILSGYTLKNNLSWEALNRKFKTTMAPYFVTCFCVTCMDVINSIVVTKQTSVNVITQIIGNDLLRSFWASGAITSFGSLAFGTRIGAIWFLPALFFATILTQALLRYVPNKKLQYFIAFTVAVLSHISGKFIWFPFSIQSAMFAVPFVLIGYDLKQHHVIEKLNLKHFLTCLSLWAVGVVIKKTDISFVSASASDLLLSPIFCLAASLCILYLSRKLEWCRPLSYVGKNSLYFLCIHLFELETMGAWFRKLLELLRFEYNALTSFLIKLIFISAITALIPILKKLAAKHQTLKIVDSYPRDVPLDIAKAILIAIMLLGHFSIDGRLRNTIYSFHMAAFVFYSGYYFRPSACQNMKRAVWRIVKSFLLPYCAYGILYILLSKAALQTKLTTIISGVSFTKKLLIGCTPVGPMYFILLLFLVRLIYLLIERYICSDLAKNTVIVCLSLIGVVLGEQGYWLPWCLDSALYMLVFYHVGYYFQKYSIMDFFSKRPWFYFLLSCFWVYGIYSGGMEIAVRIYGQYSITILGAISASVLLYMLCQYLHRVLVRYFSELMALVGRSTLYILIIHSLWNGRIGGFVANYFGFGYIFHLIITILIQLLLGSLVGLLIGVIKNHFSHR